MKTRALYFTAPARVEIRQTELPEPAEDQVLVKSTHSAISAGTELLVYRGLAPQDLPADTTITSLAGQLKFPLKYGYALVGRIERLGKNVPSNMLGQTVFSFHPHQEKFVAPLDDLFCFPENISAENALFFPNLETAINLVMDGRPLLGEQVVVFGQGVVGLLTTALLSRFPLSGLLTVEKYPLRRQMSRKLGAAQVFDSADTGLIKKIFEEISRGNQSDKTGADLIFEVSGNPAALDTAIQIAGFGSRIIVGSWYGIKKNRLNLGGNFHRNRIRLISSQVSTVEPALQGRWSKSRRFSLTWEILAELHPEELISHRFSFEQAAEAFRQLEHSPEKTLQVVLTYGSPM